MTCLDAAIDPPGGVDGQVVPGLWRIRANLE